VLGPLPAQHHTGGVRDGLDDVEYAAHVVGPQRDHEVSDTDPGRLPGLDEPDATDRPLRARLHEHGVLP